MIVSVLQSVPGGSVSTFYFICMLLCTVQRRVCVLNSPTTWEHCQLSLLPGQCLVLAKLLGY